MCHNRIQTQGAALFALGDYGYARAGTGWHLEVRQGWLKLQSKICRSALSGCDYYSHIWNGKDSGIVHLGHSGHDYVPVKHLDGAYSVIVRRKNNSSEPTRSPVRTESNIRAQDSSGLTKQVLEILPLAMKRKLRQN